MTQEPKENQVQENCEEISKQAISSKKIKWSDVDPAFKPTPREGVPAREGAVAQPQFFCRKCRIFYNEADFKWTPGVCNACYVQNETL